MFGDFDIRGTMMLVVPVLLALTVHEYAHALAAYRLGDDTAKNEGRLTLNPLVHLDPLGTIMLFFSQLFGWAKPVPFNPGNFKNPVRDTTLVALAGPVSNFITAIVVVILYRLLSFVNFFEMLGPSVGSDLAEIFALTVLINFSIGIFNLLPVPPLDGFKVLSYFLPAAWVQFAYRHSLMFLILFIVLIATGVLKYIFYPILVMISILLGLI